MPPGVGFTAREDEIKDHAKIAEIDVRVGFLGNVSKNLGKIKFLRGQMAQADRR